MTCIKCNNELIMDNSYMDTVRYDCPKCNTEYFSSPCNMGWTVYEHRGKLGVLIEHYTGDWKRIVPV